MADGAPAPGASSRSQRDEARRRRAEGAGARRSYARGRPSIDERPPPPWGSFPLSELERLRDDLAERLHDVRRTLSDRTWVEEQNRRLIEEMMLEPEKHKWVRVGNEDIGERGCKHWHVRPRWGILGMMLNWWRVRISSGCPLAT